MRTALIQLTCGDDPAENIVAAAELVRRAAQGGAEFVLTPEVTNCVSLSRTRQNEVLRTESEDAVLAGLREVAAETGIRLLIGSLALKTGDPDGRFSNRSFLIDPAGEIVARYDKIHMFDVQVSQSETFCESAGYRPGTRAVLAQVPGAVLGMTICYDLRFAYLYRALAKAGATILSVPSAFSPGTGPMHWEPLLRARAIESGAYVLAPAQTGDHPVRRGKPRRTWGHSLAVSPWGEVIADAGTEPGVTFVELDPGEVAEARRKLPSLTRDREFEGPA